MSKTILVIEDDKSVVRLLEDVLESAGFKVLVEHDGEWGLRTCQEKPVDLVILDVLIPKLKGFDLIERLRRTEKGRSLPVVVVSGVYRSARYKERLQKDHGVLEYFDKPVDVKRLVEVIRSALDPAASGPLAPAPRADSLMETLPASPPSAGVTNPWPRLEARGVVENTPFARLFGYFFTARESGSLLLRKGSTKKIVYLSQGTAVFVKSNLVSECLGRVLVAERLISDEECARSLEQKKPGKLQGEVLVEMGSISQHNLAFALELQMQMKLFEMFSWLEGHYHFIPQDDFTGQRVALALSPTALVHEGAGRAMSTERLQRDLKSVATMFVAPGMDPTLRYRALELEPDAGPLIDAISGRRTLESLYESGGLGEDEAVRLLYALATTGLLRFGAQPLDLIRPREPSVIDADALMVAEESDVEELSAEIAAVAGLGELSGDFGGAPPGARPLVVSSSSLSPSSSSSSSPSSGAEVPALLSSSPTELSKGQMLAARRTPLPRVATGLPRAQAETSDPDVLAARALEDSAPPPPLSEELRREVRARLEVEAKKISTERPAPARDTKTPSKPGGRRDFGVGLELRRDEEEMRAELLERLDVLASGDAYQVLGLSRTASSSEIRAAHERAKKEHHPERVVPGTTSRALRSLSEQIAILIDRAFDTLFDDELREAYDRKLGLRAPALSELIVAERAFLRGRDALERGDLDAARVALREAVEANPDEGAHHAFRAFAEFSAAPKHEETKLAALASLEKAEALAPELEDVFMFRGLIYQRTGNRAEAIKAFERVVRLNPDNLQALEGLKTLEPPTPKKTGLLAKLTIGGGSS